jgi:phage-related protein
MEFDIEYFEKGDGTYPVEHFILSQDVKFRAKLFRGINLLRIWGKELRMPDSSHLKEGIYELRVKHGSNIARIFYFFESGRKIFLTHGMIKKTQRTPPSEIARAIQSRCEYLSRKERKNEQELP